jgi:curved DNA-binding protein CbpA
MPTRDTFILWLRTAQAQSYYEILGIQPEAGALTIKAAFHAFGLRYHPDRFSSDPEDVRLAAAEVFKRGVEAYRVLRRPALRASYDEGLKKGRLRYEDRKVEEKAPLPQRTLEMIATTAKGKEFAKKAERFMSIGKLEEARLQLINACQCEPYNQELSERLKLVYEALALEPL